MFTTSRFRPLGAAVVVLFLSADFQRATQRVYRARGLNSSVTLLVEQGSTRALQPAR